MIILSENLPRNGLTQSYFDGGRKYSWYWNLYYRTKMNTQMQIILNKIFQDNTNQRILYENHVIQAVCYENNINDTLDYLENLLNGMMNQKIMNMIIEYRNYSCNLRYFIRQNNIMIKGERLNETSK
jgi:hypothetical protein